ncbi:anti-sigma factor domain-containing protein [Streptomyces sp. NPDC053367]|uniref:anti-sigma factor domain-containing protein n=1 Tax=Streptomyces sp. NPDC053367 TaxID=3365700 RepID=UPI0037D45617
MSEHLDPYELTGLALETGPRPTARQSRHLDRCAQCRSELDALRQVVRVAREVSTADLPTPPPDRVWDAIVAELHPGTGPVRHDPGPRPPADERSRGGQRRLRRPAVLLAAASLAAGAALGSAVTRWGLDDHAAAAAAGPSASLAPLSAARAAGTVRVVDGDSADRREVTLAVTGLPRTDGYYEVWLMDRSHTRLIAVGVLGPDGTATLPLPAGIDLAGYPLIDVSAQRDNGDPAHSGKSVVRGSLPVSVTGART